MRTAGGTAGASGEAVVFCDNPRTAGAPGEVTIFGDSPDVLARFEGRDERSVAGGNGPRSCLLKSGQESASPLPLALSRFSSLASPLSRVLHDKGKVVVVCCEVDVL